MILSPAWHSISSRGKIDRLPYFLIGALLFPVKYLLDAGVAKYVFSRTWTPWDYLISGSTLTTLARVQEDRAFFLTLFAMSIPFVVVGVVLTVARLRSIGAIPWLVLLFFLPVVNLILILILVVQPPAPAQKQSVLKTPLPATPSSEPLEVLPYGTDQPDPGFLTRFFPSNEQASFWASVGITVPIVLLASWVSIHFSVYGLAMFVGLPFITGVLTSVLHGLRQRRTLLSCVAAATMATFLSLILIFAVGLDGLGCLIMFLPLALPVTWLGALLGHSLQTSLRSCGAGRIVGSLLLFLPLFLGTERLASPPAPVFAVTTSVDVNAPPEIVWQHVISFSTIPKPDDWVFRAGAAYPIRAVINGHGVGALRECIFSTGSFVEPIRIWDEPRLLKFDVSSNPPAMNEWSPYNIHPPHVRDFLISHGGQFHLIPLPGGRTRLEGTTWYEHNLWPAAYWRLWSDLILHRIHLRVLEHVRMLSEGTGNE